MDWFNNIRNNLTKALSPYKTAQETSLQKNYKEMNKEMDDFESIIPFTPGDQSATDDLLLWCTNIQDIKTFTDSSKPSEQNYIDDTSKSKFVKNSINESLPTDSECTEWKFYLDQMISADRDKILSFLFEDDQKRAFVSIMMQRAVIRKRLNVNNDTGYTIEKTSEVTYNHL